MLMLNVVILAAGQGKRMQSDLPKVLHPIAGQPMLTHVLQTAYRLKPDRIMVVVGHGEAEIRSRFADDVGIVFVQQKQQLGTGHAVRSEEHTSELQSRGHLVCRLLLEKKNKLKT